MTTPLQAYPGDGPEQTGGQHRADPPPAPAPPPSEPAPVLQERLWRAAAAREFPLVSVFTPSHDPRWLLEAYATLKAQSYPRWEWVVLLNGPDAAAEHVYETLKTAVDHDPRVRAIDTLTAGVGALKAAAVAVCDGDILVELDHDDQLTDDALATIVDAFRDHPDAGLVYSPTIRVLEDGHTEDPTRWSGDVGWTETRAIVKVAGQERPYGYMPNLPATPHNVSFIWWAPNHVRAFTRTAYDAVGGYNPDLAVLDDQDLMCRLWQYGIFVDVGQPLYLQRIHPGQTQAQADVNPGIQTGTVDLYDRYIEANALAWARRAGLPCLDLGGAHGNADDQYLRVDQHPADGVNVVHTFPAPLEDILFSDGKGIRAAGRIGVIRAYDFLEHVADKVAMLNELHRLLAPGGILLTQTPSTDGRGAFQDPTHVSYWNENSWWYVTDPNYSRYVPELTARFQLSRMATLYPSDWHADHDISYVCANLIAVKPGMARNGGHAPFHAEAAAS